MKLFGTMDTNKVEEHMDIGEYHGKVFHSASSIPPVPELCNNTENVIFRPLFPLLVGMYMMGTGCTERCTARSLNVYFVIVVYVKITVS